MIMHWNGNFPSAIWGKLYIVGLLDTFDYLVLVHYSKDSICCHCLDILRETRQQFHFCYVEDPHCFAAAYRKNARAYLYYSLSCSTLCHFSWNYSKRQRLDWDNAVWLQTESSMYSENSWLVFLGSYYKIYIILKHGELEFCKYIDKLIF